MVEGDVAPKFITKGRCSDAGALVAVRNAQSNGVGPAFGQCSVSLLLCVVATGAGVLGRLLCCHLRLAFSLKLFRRLKRPVRRAVRKQPVAIFAVDFRALALPVRPMRPTNVRALVPLEPDPTQRVKDHALAAGDKTSAIRIFNAKDAPASTLLCKDVVQQADVGGPDVRIAGR